MSLVIIPTDSISSDALIGTVKEFVLREGTDYSHRDWTVEEKISQVLTQLKTQKVRLVYDSDIESTTIVETEQLKQLIENS